jgi:uncharacterized protein
MMNNPRLCPECDLELVTTVVATIELDSCQQCSGIWFDYNELKTVSETDSRHLPEMDNLLSVAERTVERRKRKCPCCKTLMSLKQRGDVELDNCQRCAGIWLDGGELTLVLEAYQKERERLKRGEEAGKKVLEKNLGIQAGSQRPTLAHDPALDLKHPLGRPPASLHGSATSFLTEIGVEALGAFLFGILDP